MIFLLWCHGFSTVFLILMIGLEKSDFDAQVCQSIIFRITRSTWKSRRTKIKILNREPSFTGKARSSNKNY